MLKQKLSFRSLLILTFTFLVTTFFTQWFLVSSSIYESQHLTLSNIWSKKNSSLVKCNCQLDAYLELKDLQQMKLAYLNELKKLEIKRKNQLKRIANLNHQINQLRQDLAKLSSKHTSLNFRLTDNLAKLNSLHVQTQQELSQMKSINSFVHNSHLNRTILNMSACSSDKCFNYNKCSSDRFKVFFFNSTTRSNQTEFDQTQSPLEACLVVFFMNENTRNELISSFLASHKHDQLNLVFVNLFTSQLDEFKTQSITASFEYNTNSFYSNMFIHYSVISNKSYFSQLESFHLVKIAAKRKYVLTTFSVDSRAPSLDLLTSYLSNQDSVQLNLNLNQPVRERLNTLCDSRFTLLIRTSETKKWCAENTLQLIESLKCASIPVLVESDMKLPLDNLIAWDEIVVRVPLSNLGYLLPLLISMNPNELAARQIKATNVFSSYFSSELTMIRTLVAAIQFNLNLVPPSVRTIQASEINEFPITSHSSTSASLKQVNYKNDQEAEQEYLGVIDQKQESSLEYANNLTLNRYSMWNRYYYPFGQFPSTPFDSNINYPSYDDEFTPSDLEFIKQTNYSIGGFDGKYFHHRLGANYVEEQFTIVILTYNRENNLISLVSNYVKLPYLHSILIVWNSEHSEPSKQFELQFKAYLDSKRVRLIRMNRNSLNNRFLPFDLIKTDAVLSLDDDTSLRADEIVFAFRVWRTNRDQIVGFPARFHAWNFNANGYVYNSSLSCEYSMVLTGAAFYHRFYNYYYTHAMYEKIRAKVDELNNCEDIAFNMMVAHLTRKPPVKVTTKIRFFCPECGANSGAEQISFKKDHYSNRSHCIQYFSRLYKYNPLMYSQYRADSVLYKTRLNDDHQKCFKYI